MRDNTERTRLDAGDFQHRIDGEGTSRVDVDYPHAVGANEPDTALVGGFDQRPLTAQPIRTGFGKPIAIHSCNPHPGTAAIIDDRRDSVSGHHDEGMVDGTGRRGDIRIGGLAQYLFASRIDGDNAPAIAMLAQIALRTGGVFRRVARGADKRDILGPEQRLG